jgi:hypothetical protein
MNQISILDPSKQDSFAEMLKEFFAEVLSEAIQIANSLGF